MKYEAVFGDQSLFDGASKEAVLVISDMTPCATTIEFFEDDKLNFETVDVDSRRLKVAMRRIIADPKRWTVADQQAGRDPKVGDRCFSDYDEQPARIIAKDDDDDFWFQCDNGYVRCTDRYKISPLEMPEEKAIRLEDEFRDAIYAQTSSLFKTSDEIKAFNIGVRSAYRAMNKPNEQS